MAETGNIWTTAKNPCPNGWRISTKEEFQSLANAGSEWKIINGVNGRVFGTATNTLFLATAGLRTNNNGTLSLYAYGFPIRCVTDE
ncbi:MAG: hypothetical protein LBQ28_10865 [Prevotellaceae bacterium]|nr:hypothetical protein [Prevotellaceae bacterium]